MRAASNLPPRDFYAIVGSLSGVTLLSWAYLVWMAVDMSSAKPCCLMAGHMHGWSAQYFSMMFLMWAVMMVGMMVPTAAPMILIYAGIARKAGREGAVIAPTGYFTAGYLAVWTVFSLAATVLQWQLDRLALLSPMMVANSSKVGAAILIAAGIYQLLPIKNSCLKHCRSPFHFLAGNWRTGNAGAFMMGVSHGTFCVGCCWVLMLLLFVGGVMNLLWIGAITVFVLLEKLLPSGVRTLKVTGALMIAAGLVLIKTGAH